MWRTGIQPGPRSNISRTGSLAAWKSAQRRSVKSAFQRTILAVAPLYRSLLSGVTFIGVTGSCGKTTTKELIAAVLSVRFRGRRTFGNRNSPGYLAKTILSVRPWDRYCVLEIGLSGRGVPLDGPLWLVRPRIGMVTDMGTDQLSAYRRL